jgi:hypothetical protein
MKSVREVLPSILRNLQSPEAKKQNRIYDEWESVVGARFARQTKPSLGKRNELYVWVKDSTLAFEINQKYKNTILKRAQAVLGEEAVKKIYVRVGQIR